MAELQKWQNEARELNAEIDMLRKALGTAGERINAQDAEIERLKQENERLQSNLVMMDTALSQGSG